MVSYEQKHMERFSNLHECTFNETKKINSFIYIALAKHCWGIKLGEFENDQKYFTR